MPGSPLHVGITVGVVIVQHPFITYPSAPSAGGCARRRNRGGREFPAARGGGEQQRFRHTPSPAPRCPSRWTGRCWWRTGRTRCGRRPLGQMTAFPRGSRTVVAVDYTVAPEHPHPAGLVSSDPDLTPWCLVGSEPSGVDFQAPLRPRPRRHRDRPDGHSRTSTKSARAGAVGHRRGGATWPLTAPVAPSPPVIAQQLRSTSRPGRRLRGKHTTSRKPRAAHAAPGPDPRIPRPRAVSARPAAYEEIEMARRALQEPRRVAAGFTGRLSPRRARRRRRGLRTAAPGCACWSCRRWSWGSRPRTARGRAAASARTAPAVGR